jgi:regulator of telomere elongation helicase 1
MCVLGSRQQMCVHKDISQLTGAAQNLACRAAVASRSCAHYRAVEAHLRDEAGGGDAQEPLDIEELVAAGRGGDTGGCGPCPYFLSRERAKARVRRINASSCWRLCVSWQH